MTAEVDWETFPYGTFVGPQGSGQHPITLAPAFAEFMGYIHASEPGKHYPVIRPDKGPVIAVYFSD